MTAFPPESLLGRYHGWGRAWGDRWYDPAARLLAFSGPARDGSGPGQHMTRDSLYYARVLLDGRREEDTGKATGIIEAVLATQVTREGSPVRGNFPWAAEAPEEKVWDPNWACFNAQTMLELLHWHAPRLPDGTVGRLERALALCAAHDLERWVSPAYTNIALLTSVCLAAGGDWLRDPALAAAGREKLQEVRACVNATRAFDEYNSPTYAAVNLRALASLLGFLRDEEPLAAARDLWRLQWTLLLERVHVRTGQLAGPHGRAYARDMLRSTHGLVKFQLHRALGDRWPLGLESDVTPSDLFPALIVADPDCPPEVLNAWQHKSWTGTVTGIVDSTSVAIGLPEVRRFPPFWRSRAGRDAWARLIESKGEPLTPAFRGVTQRITSFLGERFCLGTASAETQGDQAAPLIGHWPQAGRNTHGNYVAALALRERDGRLEYLPGGVLCFAQHEGRALGLLRFEASPEERADPDEAKALLAFQINADAKAEAIVLGARREGEVTFEQGIILRAEGMLAGIRVLRARVPGAKVSAVLRDLPAPHGPPEGEYGAHLLLEPLRVGRGDEAYVAFAFEMTPDLGASSVSALATRLAAPRVAASGGPDGWIRLAWGAGLSLETSTRVLDCRGFLTPEGEVRT